ncbi:MAG: HDOD domain-containing protein [Planctomycetota bacterium]
MNAAVLDVIKRSAAVPSMPQVVLRFLQLMQDPQFDYADLSKLLSTDPGTASEILRLCNSALFGVRQKVVSLRQALTLLGPKRTRSVLLGRYLVDSLAQKPAAGLDMSYFWRRSLAAAVVSSRLAEDSLGARREEVFISALLSDIGIPILAEAFTEQYQPILTRFAPRQRPPTAEDEVKAVGVSHAEVSAMVLSHWTFPDTVYRAVNLHQSKHPGEGEAALWARFIHSADLLAKLLCEVPDPEEVVAICTEATEFVGSPVDKLLSLLPTVESDVKELASALRIDVVPSKVYGLIAKTVRERLTSAATV